MVEKLYDRPRMLPASPRNHQQSVGHTSESELALDTPRNVANGENRTSRW